MLLAMSAGSDGSGEARFISSVPFILSPGSKIELAETVSRTLTGGDRLILEKLQLRYSASVGPYKTEAEAEVGLQRLTAALLWSALEFNVGLRYPSGRADVTLHAEPIPISDDSTISYLREVLGWQETDGFYDVDSPVIRPDHKRLVRFEGGSATITAGIGDNNFLEKVAEALEFPCVEKVAESKKLRLAIEVCAAHRFEVSERAKFVALVTALEALVPDSVVSPLAAAALSVARSAVLEVRNKQHDGSVEWTEVDRLLSRISKLKHEAIGTSMRNFALEAVQRHPSLGYPVATASALRDVYSVRSRLLHDGHVDSKLLQEKLTFLSQFVPKLLRLLFREMAGL